MENSQIQNLSETKDFQVDSANLKHVRTFCREVFEKLEINQELKDELTLTYNRQRQAAITNEILEIVGGAEALNDG